MKILVFGAGVLGTVYAARLRHRGQDVTILARGRRFAEIERNGLVLENEQTGERLAVQPHVIDRLEPGHYFDLIIVLVRKNQLASVLPLLAANCSPNILLMVNNAAGSDAIAAAIGSERVLLGFPGAGGAQEGHIVRYSIVSGLIQKTTIGELNGSVTARVTQIASVLRDAGFPAAVDRNMDAWLKTHVALVSPIADAIYTADNSNYQLARQPETIRVMIRAIKEGYRVLHALGIPVTPSKLRAVEWLPEWLLIAVMQRALATRWAELVIARHANAARDEMQTLADEFIMLAGQARVEIPSIERLYSALIPAKG